MGLLSSHHMILLAAIGATIGPGFAGRAWADPVTLTGLPLSDSADARARGTARLVGSILTYSEWPAQPDPLRLCVIGPAKHSAALRANLPAGVAIARRDLPAISAQIGLICDALYMGGLPLPAMRNIAAQVKGKAIVTIAEDDPECRSGSMFCLAAQNGSMSFQLNIDAVSRSRVKVDPRVLRLSRDYRP